MNTELTKILWENLTLRLFASDQLNWMLNEGKPQIKEH